MDAATAPVRSSRCLRHGLLLASCCALLPALAAVQPGAAGERQRLLGLLVGVDTPPAAAVAAARRSRAQAQTAGDDGLQALAYSVECRSLLRQGDMAGADTACAEARRLATSEDALAWFAANRATAALTVERGEPLAALPALAEAHAAAVRSGSDLAVAAALSSIGSAAQFAGANADAVDFYSRALSLTARISAHGLGLQVANNLGVMLLESGDAAGAREMFRAAIAAAARMPGRPDAPSARRGLALAEVEAGGSGDAAERLRRMLAAPGPQETPLQLAEALLFVARAEFHLGRLPAAEAAARDAAERLQALRPVRAVPAQALLVDILVSAGRPDEALQLADRLVRELPEGVRGRVELLEGRERALAARGRYQEAYRAALDARHARDQQSMARASRTLAFMQARTTAQEMAGLRAAREHASEDAQRERVVRDLVLALLAVTLAGSLALWSVARARRRLATEVERRRGIDALGKLTGGVAHDFNNLMTIVQQAMGLLRRDAAVRGSPQALELVAEAEDAARVGGDITRQLLAFARSQPMRPEVFELAPYLEAQRPLFEHALGATMRLVLEVNDRRCQVRVDPAQLSAALIHLLTNARDAMDGQGEVRLREASADNTGRNRRWPELAPGAYATLSVIDTGRGMSPEMSRQATLPFFTTKSTDVGIGLGLSTAYGFARQSRGHLQIESTPAAGTMVTLVLPVV